MPVYVESLHLIPRPVVARCPCGAPLSSGQENRRLNPLCKRCNSRKVARERRASGISCRIHVPQCAPGRKRHAYSNKGICIHCKQTKINAWTKVAMYNSMQDVDMTLAQDDLVRWRVVFPGETLLVLPMTDHTGRVETLPLSGMHDAKYGDVVEVRLDAYDLRVFVQVVKKRAPYQFRSDGRDSNP